LEREIKGTSASEWQPYENSGRVPPPQAGIQTFERSEKAPSDLRRHLQAHSLARRPAGSSALRMRLPGFRIHRPPTPRTTAAIAIRSPLFRF